MRLISLSLCVLSLDSAKPYNCRPVHLKPISKILSYNVSLSRWYSIRITNDQTRTVFHWIKKAITEGRHYKLFLSCAFFSRSHEIYGSWESRCFYRSFYVCIEDVVFNSPSASRITSSQFCTITGLWEMLNICHVSQISFKSNAATFLKVKIIHY